MCFYSPPRFALRRASSEFSTLARVKVLCEIWTLLCSKSQLLFKETINPNLILCVRPFHQRLPVSLLFLSVSLWSYLGVRLWKKSGWKPFLLMDSGLPTSDTARQEIYDPCATFCCCLLAEQTKKLWTPKFRNSTEIVNGPICSMTFWPALEFMA